MVLNSAERAPYLLIVEILHHDLDFNPTSQSNKELLATLQKNGPSPIRDTGSHPSIYSPGRQVCYMHSSIDSFTDEMLSQLPLVQMDQVDPR